MAHHHHHHHRPHRISVPPRAGNITTTTTTTTTPTPSTRYSSLPYPSATPTPTPTTTSSHRSFSFSSRSSQSNKSSLSFLFLILFSLRSLYSLLPFLRSSPSFSLFPFTFLVSLLSFLLSLSFSLFPFSSSKSHFIQKQQQPIFSFLQISPSQHKFLLAKSFLLACVFLLRFQALRYCGTAAMILAEISGNVAGRFVAEGRKNGGFGDLSKFSKVRGFSCMLVGLLLLSISWDRTECFPFSNSFVEKWGLSVLYRDRCVRLWTMLLPFLSGFLGCYERVSMNWGTIRQLSQKQVRLISLFYMTVLLLFPALVSWIVFEKEGDGVSIANLAWPLANTVVFGVLLSENYSDEKFVSSKDFQREFLVTLLCTIVLELFYYPELSLWGLLLCVFLFYCAVRELDPAYSDYHELGFESSESFSTSIMKPIHHILSERKSRKIALFLLINTGYMVVEFVAGFMSNSLGLISDACHMLFDCAALAIGLYASYISRLPANNQFNYGRGRFEVLSGYANAVFLVLVGALIVLESFERILEPQEISTNSLLTVSIGGLLVNVVGLIFFHEEHHHAHGGSCSHSHSHHHHQHLHDHEGHSKHHECISISHESHRQSCSSHHNHQSSKPGDAHHHSHHENCDSTYKDDHAHRHNHECISIYHESHGQSCSSHHDHQLSKHGDTHHHGHHENCDSTHKDDHAHRHNHHDHAHKHDDYEHYHVHECPLHSLTRSLDIHSNGEAEKQKHQHIDHNMEGIFLHVLADTMGSVGVVISTLLIKYKGWLVADPACSIFISVLIVCSVIPLLRNSAEILLQRVPRAHEVELKEALNDVMKIEGVSGIQNPHIWSFTSTDVIGTLHLRVSEGADGASIKAQVSHMLNDAGIKDLTLQMESVR